MPRLFLLDGTALAYRAHFALFRSGLTDPDGRPTGAVYGFTMTLRRLLETEKPDLVAVAFDPPGPTFRHHEFADYKATRQKAPEEMIAQLDLLRDVVRAHGLPIFEVPGFEADDVIGTLARQAEAAGMEVMIVTGDKDLMQVVSEKTRLYNVFKPGVDLVIEDIEAVERKFGTTPDHVIDVLALMGDSSDNIPGVKGIGEKGASKLIEQFGSVAGLLERLDEVKGKAREAIERDREQLLMSLRLVTIDTQVPLPRGLESIRPPHPDQHALIEIFSRLGFQTLVKSVLERSESTSTMERDYVLVLTAEALESMCRELVQAGAFAVDTETTGLDSMRVSIVGVSFSASAGRAFYVPFNASPPVLPGGAPAILEALRELLTSPDLKRIGQNYKYDALVFHTNGIEVPPPDFDTMVASFCIAGATRRHNLDDLALKYFGLKKISTSQIIGKGKDRVTMAEVMIDQVAEYACEDADVTFRLYEVMQPELVETESLELFETLELPLVGVLTAMEKRGIRIDSALIQGLSKDLQRDIDQSVAELHRLAGEEFNVNSTKTLGAILFEKLRIQDEAGVKKPKRTKTGFSTDQGTLSQQYGQVEIVERLLEYREVAKLKSTYVDTLPGFVNPRTGRIHCSFSQVTAATGRLASSDPNLQNIPVRSERGRRLREAFIPCAPDEAGEWILLAADYSQVELRIMAHLAGDATMAAAFSAGADIHASTAALIFDVPPESVDRAMRSRAKAINFGLLYGMGPQRLARENDMSISEAKEFIERYFASFPQVRGWIDRTLEFAREHGYVETLLGRRRRILDIDSQNSRARAMAENVAVNTPVQGSAADVIKLAMIHLERRLEESALRGRMLLQVHDELLLELPVSELEQTTELVRDCMENAVSLSVPLKVDFGHGGNWLEAH